VRNYVEGYYETRKWVRGNLDQSILCKAKVDMINLQRYAEAGGSDEDKNNEKKERRGENLICWS
jgi:hypothetical protein